jgi:hypothetical protein
VAPTQITINGKGAREREAVACRLNWLGRMGPNVTSNVHRRGTPIGPKPTGSRQQRELADDTLVGITNPNSNYRDKIGRDNRTTLKRKAEEVG